MNFRRMFIYQNKSESDSGSAGGGATSIVHENNELDDRAIIASEAIEAEASKMGWTTKDQFKGDPEKWRSADEFVERGKNMLPIVQAKVKRQEAQIDELTRTVKDFAEHMSKTEQRAYDRALSDLKQQRKEALAAGDGDTFDKVDDAIDQLKVEAQSKAAKVQAASDSDPVYAEWESRQTWLKDKDMADYGEFVAQRLRNTGEKSTGAEFLELVTRKVKSQFPEKFENPRRTSAASVEGAAPAARKGGKGYADMPADARAACDRMAKNGFSSDAQAAADFKASFTKNFFEEA